MSRYAAMEKGGAKTIHCASLPRLVRSVAPPARSRCLDPSRAPNPTAATLVTRSAGLIKERELCSRVGRYSRGQGTRAGACRLAAASPLARIAPSRPRRDSSPRHARTQINHLIGRGQYSTVYAAQHVASGTAVALKKRCVLSVVLHGRAGCCVGHAIGNRDRMACSAGCLVCAAMHGIAAWQAWVHAKRAATWQRRQRCDAWCWLHRMHSNA
eukprot:365612-Chlamydomonas_euryale.AAC.8